MGNKTMTEQTGGEGNQDKERLINPNSDEQVMKRMSSGKKHLRRKRNKKLKFIDGSVSSGELLFVFEESLNTVQFFSSARVAVEVIYF